MYLRATSVSRDTKSSLLVSEYTRYHLILWSAACILLLLVHTVLQKPLHYLSLIVAPYAGDTISHPLSLLFGIYSHIIQHCLYHVIIKTHMQKFHYHRKNPCGPITNLVSIYLYGLIVNSTCYILMSLAGFGWVPLMPLYYANVWAQHIYNYFHRCHWLGLECFWWAPPMLLYGPSRLGIIYTDAISWAQNFFGGCPRCPCMGPADLN